MTESQEDRSRRLYGPWDFTCSTSVDSPRVITTMRACWAAESYAANLSLDPKDGEWIRVEVFGPTGDLNVFDVVAEVRDPSWRAREVNYSV
jgi:hypothetical protein